MMSPIPLRSMLAAAFLAAVSLAAPAVAAAPLAPPAANALSAHEEALRVFFAETRLFAMARINVVRMGKPGYQRKLFEHFFRTHGEAALEAEYARHVAGQVTPADSAAAVRVVRLSQMRALMRESERLLERRPDQLPQSPEITRLDAEISKLARPADLQAMRRLLPLSKGVGAYLAQRMGQHDAELARPFGPIMIEMMRLSTRSDFTVAEIPAARVGFEPLDHMLEVFAESLRATAALIEEEARVSAAIPLDTVLEAKYMVNRPGIERGRGIVAQAEQVKRKFLSRYQDIFTRRAEGIRDALKDLPSFNGAQLDEKASQTMAFLLQVNENQQRQFAVLQRMLDFAESRLGQTSLQDELLRFASDADVEIWRAMIQEVTQLDKDGTDKLDAQLNKENQLIRQLEKKS